MSTFGITVGSSEVDKIGAINYLLSNIGANLNTALTANTATGAVTVPSTGQVFSYIYRYITVAYAQSADGTVNFSTSPTFATYYGIRNRTDTSFSTNPADFVWFSVPGGFGNNKHLYYSTQGGGSIVFIVSTTLPGTQWAIEAQLPIDLTYITTILANQVNPGSVLLTTGSNPTWQDAASIRAGLALQVQLNAITTQTYYLSMASTSTNYGPLSATTGLSYTSYTTATNNTLSVPNTTIGGVINLQPQSAQPQFITTGTIATADRVNWDPIAVGSGPAYPVFYDGSAWHKMIA
jgi:hypothetical protein